LRITEEYISDRNRTTEPASLEEMLTAPKPAVYDEIVMLKNIVPNPRWFDNNKTKFEDWWREIQLFLKSNKVVATDDKIIIVLAQLRGGIVGIYAQNKINQIEKENNFVKEVKIRFSDKSKAVDVK